MDILNFFYRKLYEICESACRSLVQKFLILLGYFFKIFSFVIAIPFVLMIRCIKPIYLVRIGNINSSRIGHFVSRVEIYLCEIDANINTPKQRYLDLFYINPPPISNKQLLKIWRREIKILHRFALRPLDRVNRVIPGGVLHVIKEVDLDTNDLLAKFPSHLRLTAEEELLGQKLLLEMGIPIESKFICLHVRDDAYLKAKFRHDYSYHNYRDSDIRNYILAAESLAEKGYYVIRMGAKVNHPLNTKNTRVIDYATNGMRNDFMDIYLGIKCFFAIATGSGWDSIPEMARRPIVYVNFAPLGGMHTSRSEIIGIAKKHYSCIDDSQLTFSQIISKGAHLYTHSETYEKNGIKLVENTPEEILDIVIEMLERLTGIWIPHPDDEILQKKFWSMFPANALLAGLPLHGKIRARYGASFLRNNQKWLQ